MEMEASRRSMLDRSRDLPAKKPRMADEADRDRSSSAGLTSDRNRLFAPARPAAAGAGGANPRFRSSEREERQQQELVMQYRTALAELTFNSKPIITNLTIIAGESLHVAKSIAATVCDNVVKVPSEQKLPSLYLLDSIVKNIGGDYIKYFAARLPQVFCKAYKQVDPAIHQSLRHLFGTWKGVFPTSCLQSIENELGFQPVINGSSGGTGTRPDAQSQRPSHSIHVNPKYLEARQRFQQSTKGKEVSSEDIDEVVAPVDDTERSIKNPSSGSMRQWAELSNKVPDVQHSQREQKSDFTNERKSFKDIRDTGFSSQLSRQQDAGVGRIIDRGKDLDELGRTVDQISESDEPSKPYYEAGGATAYRRNGFDVNHAYGNYQALESAPSNNQVPSINSNRTNWPLSKNWKTSEEEEYIWDDMGSRSADYEGASNRRNTLSTDDQDKRPSLQSRKWMSMETDQVDSRLNKFDSFHPRAKIVGTKDRLHFPRDHEEHYSQQHSQEIEPTRLNKGSWPLPLREHALPALRLDSTISRVSGQTERRSTPLGGIISTNDNSVMPRSGFQSTLSSSLGSSIDVLGSGVLGQQRQVPLRSPSPTFPSIPSAALKQQKLHTLIDQDYPPFRSSQIGQKSSQLADQFNRDTFAPVSYDSFPVLSEKPGQKSHTPSNSQPSPPLTSLPVSSPLPELKQQHISSLRPLQSDPPIKAVQNETSVVPVSQGFRGNESKVFSGVMHSNCPIDVSGQSNTNNQLSSFLKTDILTSKIASGLNIHPPLPSGPPPAQALSSSASLPTSSSEMIGSHGITPAFAPSLLPGGMLPPLPPGPPPSTSLLGTSQTTNSTSLGLNPLSSLLSSLVAKGLITSASTQLPTITSNQMSKESSSQNSDLDASTSSKEPLVCEASSFPHISLDENLIGTQFKTEFIREFHPSVIHSILDNLKHRCISCGLRFRHQHQLQSHLDWHDSNNSEISNFDRVCRRWYSSIDSWVSGDYEPPCGPVLVVSSQGVSEELLEPMVLVDEKQSICVLCGEPFEDFYSIERDEWMYKKTVYLNLTDGKCVASGMENNIVEGPIVHANCISESAVDGDVVGYS